MSKRLKDEIDYRRGDIPRSKYISRILERQLFHENDVKIQLSQSRPSPGHNSADSLSLPSTPDSQGEDENDKE
jgi:hypothetical protein